MSEIKEKYIEFIKNMYGLNEADFETALDPLHYFSATTAFIESNYIPREEHEELRNFRDDLTDKTIQKLKEENERLKKQLPELLKKQRQNCNMANLDRPLHYESSDAILSAPEPSIEDLNKE